MNADKNVLNVKHDVVNKNEIKISHDFKMLIKTRYAHI